MQEFKTNDHSRCPHCGVLTPRATGVSDGRAPRAGDLTLCVACAHPSRFAADLSLERLPDDSLTPEIRAELERLQIFLGCWRAAFGGSR
jgi:hypothetical protein